MTKNDHQIAANYFPYWIGIANGVANPPLSTLAMGTVPPSKIGMASGISNVSRQIGISFGIAFLGAMLTNRYNIYVQNKVTALSVPGLPAAAKAHMISGIEQAGTIDILIIAGCILAFGALVSLVLIRNKDMYYDYHG